MHAVHSRARRKPTDLHYSAVFGLSDEAVNRVRQDLLRSLERHVEIVKESDEQVAYAYAFDFYPLCPDEN